MNPKSIKPGEIYVLSDLESFGKLPVRSELTVIQADQPARKIGWTVHEYIGVGICNPWPFYSWHKKLRENPRRAIREMLISTVCFFTGRKYLTSPTIQYILEKIDPID